MCYLELENISKTYGSGNEPVTAVSEVSLSVERGEFIAITGPSGCGKSTLLHIIGGLNRLSEGNVYVEGRSLYRQKAAGLALYRRRRVGIVYQFYNLVPELTARKNLILPALMDRRKVKKAWVIRFLTSLVWRIKGIAIQVSFPEGSSRKLLWAALWLPAHRFCWRMNPREIWIR